MTQLKPYKFHRLLKSVLWGGERMAYFKGLESDVPRVGESWEISGVKGNESVVKGGDDDGLTLSQLIERHKGQLVGEAVYAQHGNQFPLLIKFIDAEQDLSLQVHPNDELAKQRHNCYGKTEMWYLIDHKPGAKILSGMSQEITPEEYEQRVADGTILDVVAQHESHVGDVFFLPSGRIHGIGAGNLIAEVQQTSDITYRVYDYDRRDADGNARELHVEQARDAIDYTVHDSYVLPNPGNAAGETTLVKCPYFDVHRLMLDGVDTIDNDKDSFLIVMCLKGTLIITDENGHDTPMHRGETILVPATLHRLHLDGQATLLTATV
ncbi:MAG: class I mannose-6-phosphate isomerase [Bacteroidales bacterium]|uniref:type I phosphomannose isomerase catalytic subunit n=1 Tax=Sodaliphilus sp. TaxID=2815818 RepID=UPI001B75521B|nr:class I mannose-6-phosphate isomerase [Candidatus Sodaliphilus limicaballi]